MTSKLPVVVVPSALMLQLKSILGVGETNRQRTKTPAGAINIRHAFQVFHQ